MSREEDIDEVEESTSSIGKRSRKCTSQVWEYFKKLDKDQDGRQFAECKWCAQSYLVNQGYGTKNLLRHINSCPMKEVQVSEASHSIFDDEVYREKVAISIIKHNFPFSYVEHEGVRDVHSYLNPRVKSICRNTAKVDVLKVFRKEKEKLMHILSGIGGRVCLTSDLWSSITTDHYMAITAHFIDSGWALQKRILCFTYVPPPYSGVLLAEKLFGLLKEWGIEKKIFSITLDNASYNDTMVDVLRQHDFLGKFLSCNDTFLHVRCGAHILNLIVQEGLKVTDICVEKIRESVKYVRATNARKVRFSKCISRCSVSCRQVRQDVPTRWNSTYLMIESALLFQRAFHYLSLIDMNFKTCPTLEEWDQAERIMKILKPFYEITTLFSGTKYPTANLYFHGVWKIELRLKEEEENEKNMEDVVCKMAKRMKKKFDKYWHHYSEILSIAIILDPRYKLDFVEYCFNKIDNTKSKDRVVHVRNKLYSLFEEYKTSQTNDTSIASFNKIIACIDDDDFDDFQSEIFGSTKSKSQLDMYLEEPRLDRKQFSNLEVLDYWKDNSVRYSELSSLARDILSIPITSVTSESAFSIGGRILDKYRSSLLPQNAEALLCTRDWLCATPISEEELEESLIEDFEETSYTGNVDAGLQG